MTHFFKIILLLLPGFLCGQSLPFHDFSPAPKPKQGIRLAFYNVENYFDIFDDSTIIDEEFLPTSEKQWNEKRYADKRNRIAKTLLAIGGDYPVGIAGFCEIENRAVMEDLLRSDLLENQNYALVHRESQDARGIDVSLIYHKKLARLLHSAAIKVRQPQDSNWRTRDILYVKLALTKLNDTVHVFVNHWPSRRGGEEASRPLRLLAANTLKQRTDSILAVSPRHSIVIMGDLNDGPSNASLIDGLQVKNTEVAEVVDLVDLMALLPEGSGTHKYRGVWEYLDHLVVNAKLLKAESKVYTPGARVFKAQWLMETDERYTGDQPKRTYAGPRYLDGFSDHLPVYLDIMKR